MKGEEEKRRGERTEAGTCRKQARVTSVSTSHMHMNSDVGQAASPRGQGEGKGKEQAGRCKGKHAGARARSKPVRPDASGCVLCDDESKKNMQNNKTWKIKKPQCVCGLKSVSKCHIYDTS